MPRLDEMEAATKLRALADAQKIHAEKLARTAGQKGNAHMFRGVDDLLLMAETLEVAALIVDGDDSIPLIFLPG